MRDRPNPFLCHACKSPEGIQRSYTPLGEHLLSYCNSHIPVYDPMGIRVGQWLDIPIPT